jgi:hypothetical protein
MQGYMLSNGNNQWYFRLDGILDSFAAMGCRHENSGSIRFELFFCFPQIRK